ncbi:MAG: DUF488 family protein [Deltaproteobacteria bacterium]|nr:DUF488 family protein [Deltaproteobacteria bacterium]
MDIRIKRVYEKPDPGDGTRILVDRLWPRGLSKEAAKIDYWALTVSPSNELRKWYGHDPAKWVEFQRRYAAELDEQAGEVAILRKRIEQGPATFLYGSTEKELNNAHALKLYLKNLENLTKLQHADDVL